MADELEHMFPDRPMEDASVTYDPREITDSETAFEELSSHVRMMIMDARDFNEQDLTPKREQADRYFQGLEPVLAEDNRSTIVMTEVRDVIMGIMPSLMRIFTSQEKVVNFVPNTEDGVEMARQATDYIDYVFMEDNDGYNILHAILMDALKKSLGVVMWYVDDKKDITYRQYDGVDEMVAKAFFEATPNAELVGVTPNDQNPDLYNLVVRITKNEPELCIEAVPPEEFRINRNAKSIKNSILVGRERMMYASDLLEMGYPKELVDRHRSASGDGMRWAAERVLRNPGIDESLAMDADNSFVQYGEYYMKIDTDGDGITELCRVCVIGDSDEIVTLEHVSQRRLALFCPDPEPHTVIGHGIAELVIDLQKIKTNIMRNTLDSLAQTIFPRPVVNETLTNMEDVLDTGVGSPIRTKGPVQDAVQWQPSVFNGDQAFNVVSYLDNVRQMRTGVSEASKGVDPRALQSTTVKGVDMLITGAQERIELIARNIANSGMKDLFKGLLQDICDYPAPQRTIELRGKFVTINPSQYDAGMKVRVNPSMGKGSDADRLLMLTQVKATQESIISTTGADNPLVSPIEYRNTLEDILNICNIRDTSRYFKQVTPEQLSAYAQQKAQQAAQQPNPAVMLAQTEAEKVKSGVVTQIAKTNLDKQKMMLDDVFRNKKLAADIANMIANDQGKYGITPTMDLVKHFTSMAHEAHIAREANAARAGGEGVGSGDAANQPSNG